MQLLQILTRDVKEWLGGFTTTVESNYFGKGNTTTYDRAIYHNVTAPQDEWHMYTIDWTSDYVRWIIDGVQVRQLNYTDALYGKNFPQTPMRVKMGNWDGGASTENAGTIEWAGGLTDFSVAPFVMYVKNITIQDYSSGGNEYVWGDQTGSWESIVIKNGTEDAGNILTGSKSSKSTSSSSSSSATGTSATSDAHKFGAADGFVIALGLVMGYFFM